MNEVVHTQNEEWYDIPVQDYRNLLVWQKAHGLTLSVYRVTNDFPQEERFGMTSQLRRSAVSIQANVAEGAGRRTARDFAHFIDIALGSTNEVECLIILARDLEYINDASVLGVKTQVTEVRRMLTVLSQTIRSKSEK